MPTLTQIYGAVCLSLALAGAAIADEQGDALKDKVVNAYKNAKTHQSTVQLERTSRNFGWTLTQSGEFKVAFDRDAQRLRVLTPELEMAVAEGKVWAKSEMVPSRHLEADAPTPVDYLGVVRVVPYVTRPVPVPEMALLLADEPFAVLGDGSSVDAKVLGADAVDPLKRERLELTNTREKTTLWLDSSTHLVSEILVEPFAEPGRPGRSDMYRYRITVEKHDQPIEGAALTFDPAGTDAAATLQEWVRGPEAARAAKAQADAQAAREAENPLVGKAAPEIEAATLAGQPFKLSALKQRVVVLDFWATWCGPCVASLPHLEKVQQWIKEQKKDAVLHPINLGEPIETVKPFWEEKKFSMVTVLDTQEKSSQPYGIEGIPMTVVISDGKIRHVHIGFNPAMEDVLKKEIDALLSEKK